jgi:hypothetical protein
MMIKDHARFEVLDAVLMKIPVFMVMIPCRVVHRYNIHILQHFEKTSCR